MTTEQLYTTDLYATDLAAFTLVADKSLNEMMEESNIKRRKDGNPKWTRSNKKKGVSSLVYPIKDEKKFAAFNAYFREQIDKSYTEYQRYVAARNNLLVAIGNNTAYRISDIVRLTWGDLLGYKVRKQEKKTKKFRTVFFNDLVIKAMDIFFEVVADTKYDVKIDGKVPLDDYVFCTCKSGSGHMTEANALDFVKKAARAVGIEDNVGTHTLRKNFVYWTLRDHPDDQNVLYTLMRLLNHSSPAMTFLYATITEEETHVLFKDISKTYRNVIKGAFDGLRENVVSMSYDRVMELVKYAYETGKEGTDEDNNNLDKDNLETLEQLLKGLIV